MAPSPQMDKKARAKGESAGGASGNGAGGREHSSPTVLPPNIAGVMGEISDDLAIASVRYHREQRNFIIFARDRMPLSRDQAQDDFGTWMFDKKDELALLEEEF